MSSGKFESFNCLLINSEVSIISSGGFLPVNSVDYLFESDLSKIILSFNMMLSFFSLFLIYNLIFLIKKN